MKHTSPYAPGDKYVPVADGLRAIFIFIVAWYHIWQQSWLSPNLTIGTFTLDIYPLIRTGYMWVDGMLLLSGFLTFLPYARAMLGKKPLPDAATFYKKRAARILPAYLFCVLLLLFCDALPNHMYSSPKWLWTDLLSHLTFTHTFFSFSYFNTCLNVVLWTLAVEVQFYLVFPLLAKAFTRKPAATFAGMVAAAWLYRGYVTLFVASNNIWINQLIANEAIASAITPYKAKSTSPNNSKEDNITMESTISNMVPMRKYGNGFCNNRPTISVPPVEPLERITLP